MKKVYTLLIIILACSRMNMLMSQSITVINKGGEKFLVTYTGKTISNAGVTLNTGVLLQYDKISNIGTDHFDVYDKAMRKAGKKGNEHLNIEFTGDQNLYALQLKKLEEKRNSAHVTRGAGGLLMLIGAISGDEDVYAVGAVSYIAGTVARDINTEKTISAQNDAIVALQNQQKKVDETESIEEEYRREWGPENVDGLIALLNNDHKKALAFANVGETSKDANHRLAAVWLKATIYADQGKNQELEKEYERLIVLDPEVDSVEDGKNWMKILLDEVNELRKS